MSNFGLGVLASILLFLSLFGNLFVYFETVVNEDRPGARKGYFAFNALWLLMNIGVVALLIFGCS